MGRKTKEELLRIFMDYRSDEIENIINKDRDIKELENYSIKIPDYRRFLLVFVYYASQLEEENKRLKLENDAINTVEIESKLEAFVPLALNIMKEMRQEIVKVDVTLAVKFNREIEAFRETYEKMKRRRNV